MKLWIVSTAALAALAGCGESGTVVGTDDAGIAEAGAEAGADACGAWCEDAGAGGLGDASAEAGPGDGAPPPAWLAGVRLANWSPDAPAVDLCLAPHGTGAFQGPLVGAQLAALSDAGLADGGATGVGFPQASAYAYLTPGHYDARLVAAGSPDCSVGVLTPDDASLAPLAAGSMTTIAAVGEVGGGSGAPGVALTSFADDFDGRLEGGPPIVPLRFVAAAPGVAQATVGTGKLADLSFQQWFVGVPFGQAGTAKEAEATESGPAPSSVVDGNGYLLLAQLWGQTVSVHAFKTRSDLAIAAGLNAVPGTVVTIVLVGDATLQLVECFDSAATGGLLSACSVVSQ
jgi:hypothetical protein